MKRNVYLACGFSISVLVLGAAGCRDSGGTTDGGTVIHDLSVVTPPQDLTGGCQDPNGCGPRDLSVPPTDIPPSTGFTINGIDTGTVAAGTMGTVMGMVVTGPIKIDGVTKSTMKCKYTAFVQDPNGASPSGIKLFAQGAVCTPSDMGKCLCPIPGKASTGSAFDMVQGNLAVGDIVTISGKAGSFQPSTDAGVQPAQHELDFMAISKTGSGGTITPFVVTNNADFANGGMGFLSHEDEVVTVKAATPTAIPAGDSHGTYTWAGAQFNDTYRFNYGKDADGGLFPGTTNKFSAVTGVAENSFGGEILPRTAADFTP